MILWAAWPSYTTTVTGGTAPATTYDTTCHDCDTDTETISTTHADTFNVTLECSGGAASETFGTPGADGLSGSVTVEHCCESCDCDSEAGTPFCTQVTVVIHAQWSGSVGGNALLYGSTCDECYNFETELFEDYGSVQLDTAFTQNFTVINSVTIVYERTVMDTQANERLAPGAYTVKSVTVSTVFGDQLTVVDTSTSGPVVGNPCFWDGDCSCNTEADTNYTETEDCSDALLATHGWTVSFSVAS